MQPRRLSHRPRGAEGSSSPDTANAITATSPAGVKARQRRWTPKVKTGCLTCRVRRVKCDEAKPSCNRCASTGRRCDGYTTDTNEPHRISQRGHQTMSALALTSRRRETLQKNLPVLVKVNPDPPDWDFAEACKYYDHFIYAAQADQALAPSSYYVPPSDVKFHCKHPFITYVIAHRISCLSRINGSLAMSDDTPATAHLWPIFYQGVSAAILSINQALSSSTAANQFWIFTRIVDILSVELWLVGVAWRAHIEGFLALLHLTGGVKRTIERIGRPRLSIQYVLIAAAMANTTSPANDQIMGLSIFKASDLYNVYSNALYPDMPCPTRLFLEINRITHLRVQLQKQSCSVAESFVLASHILCKVDSFIPQEWEEEYPLPDRDVALLLARIYKSAVTLYAILSLSLHEPPQTTTELETSTEMYQLRKMRERDYLVKLIGEGMELLAGVTPLCWPLAVVGVALADGAVADQTLVIKHLYNICATPETYRGPVLLISRLQRFWASGRSRWEDCFNEACTVLG